MHIKNTYQLCIFSIILFFLTFFTFRISHSQQLNKYIFSVICKKEFASERIFKIALMSDCIVTGDSDSSPFVMHHKKDNEAIILPPKPAPSHTHTPNKTKQIKKYILKTKKTITPTDASIISKSIKANKNIVSVTPFLIRNEIHD